MLYFFNFCKSNNFKISYFAYRCRHWIFAEFFDDTKPKCENRCDACRDKKKVEKELELFKSNTQEYNSIPQSRLQLNDYEDLYGGGRKHGNQ